MQSSNGTRSQAPLDSNSSEREWVDFLGVNSSAMFQLALLLSANSHAAELALLKSVDDLEIARPPRNSDLAAWQDAVVAQSISAPEIPTSAADQRSFNLLQPGLWPVVRIDRFPRICFVLRLFLGYPRTACAQFLGIDESNLEELLQTAIEKLGYPGQ
jgi:hypothetical protein